jgi:hypothetical protein
MSIAIVADKTAGARVNSGTAAPLISPLRENRTAVKATRHHNGCSVRGKNLQSCVQGSEYADCFGKAVGQILKGPSSGET